MARIAPPTVADDETAANPSVPGHVAEARAIRRRFLEEHGDRIDDDPSPQAFYERSVRRPDIREILEQLAKN